MNLPKSVECLEPVHKELHAEREVKIATRGIPRRFLPTVAALLLFIGFLSSASASVWTGAGDGNDWFDAANWDPAAVPGATSEVVIDSGASVLLTNSTAALSSFTLTNATLTASNWMTRVQADTVTIADGGTMTLPVPFAVGAMSNRIWIVCDAFVLASGGALNADGLGYNYQQGPGKAANVGSTGGPGAGHGGHGGAGMTLLGGIAYGAITEPTTAGSGSGKTTNKTGVPGGGVIRIEASGAVTLDGTVSANGLDGQYYGFGRHSGGSAGGSIWISCETLSATGGSVLATGGQGQESGSYSASGAGAGGRIAIHYDPVAQGAQPLPNLVLDTTPGPGNMNIVSAIAPTEPMVRTGNAEYFTIAHEADWGSIYLSDASGVIQITQTISDIGGHVSFGSGAAPTELNSLTVTNAFIGFETNTSITVQGAVNIEHGAGLIARQPLSLSVGGDWNNRGWTRLEDGSAVSVAGGMSIENEGRFFLADDAVLDVAGDLAVSGERANLVLRDMTATVTGNLSLADNAWFAPLGGATNGTGEAGLELTVLGELRLDPGSWIYPYTHPQNGGAPRLVLGSLHVPTEAGVDGDARGFDFGAGPGAGKNVFSLSPSSGGGHGGRGGDSSRSGAVGGEPYGDRLLPGTPGSGGASTKSAAGGRGGSSIRLVVDGNSLLKGVLTVRGGDGGTYSGREGGGGAGGGVLVITDGLITDSNTVFHAIGGNASGTLDVSGAGSGGGGRIAIWYGLSAADRQPLLDDLDNPSVQRRLLESESMEGFEGQFSFLNGTGGYEEGDPGTGIFVKMLHPPGTLFMIR